MTSEEAKRALFQQTPVKWRDIEFERITAIIYRFDLNNGLIVSCELLDKKKNSVTVVKITDVQRIGE